MRAKVALGGTQDWDKPVVGMCVGVNFDGVMPACGFLVVGDAGVVGGKPFDADYPADFVGESVGGGYALV